MKKIFILNGPNLNLLGIREPGLYGTESYDDLVKTLDTYVREKGFSPVFIQSNHEGDLVDAIHRAFFEGALGVVINPGAYTHTSVALLDAVKAVGIPTVEVHLSNIQTREEFRKRSYVSMVAVKTICGLGFEGYRKALDYFAK